VTPRVPLTKENELLEIEHARGERRASKHRIGSMVLHALDAWVRDPAVLTDAVRLRAILRAAAAAGGATVVGEEFVVFPNGGVTGVLLLAQSHLSIHTWPEFGLANVDLLSYGHVSGNEVMRVICAGLDVDRSEQTRIPRTIG
jgi:S-adenosylmethionine decarboxylase